MEQQQQGSPPVNARIYPKSITRFKHQQPHKSQHQPHPHVPPKYGQKIQLAQLKERELCNLTKNKQRSSNRSLEHFYFIPISLTT